MRNVRSSGFFRRLKDATRQRLPTLTTAQAILAVIGAGLALVTSLIGGAIVVVQHLTDPKDSRIHLVYQGIADAPVVSLAAINDGTRTGSIDRAVFVAFWQVDGRELGFAVTLRVGTPLAILPGRSQLELPINFWKIHRVESTTEADVALVLSPAETDKYSTAPIARAKCLIQYDVINAQGTRQHETAILECVRRSTMVSSVADFWLVTRNQWPSSDVKLFCVYRPPRSVT